MLIYFAILNSDRIKETIGFTMLDVCFFDKKHFLRLRVPIVFIKKVLNIHRDPR